MRVRAAALLACAAVVADCGDEKNSADKCKVPEIAPGHIPSSDELLPPRDECPEFYKGRPGGTGGAPPVPNQPPPVKLPEPAPPPPAPGLEPGEHDIPSPPAPPYAPGY